MFYLHVSLLYYILLSYFIMSSHPISSQMRGRISPIREPCIVIVILLFLDLYLLYHPRVIFLSLITRVFPLLLKILPLFPSFLSWQPVSCFLSKHMCLPLPITSFQHFCLDSSISTSSLPPDWWISSLPWVTLLTWTPFLSCANHLLFRCFRYMVSLQIWATSYSFGHIFTYQSSQVIIIVHILSCRSVVL